MPTPTFSGASLDNKSLKPRGDFKILETLSSKPKEKIFNRPQMSPSLYATPKEIILPNSPSSSPPSPYIVNHKARGPAPSKSSSDVDVPCHTKAVRERTAWDHNSSVGIGSNNAENCLEWESYLLNPVRIKANKDCGEYEDYYKASNTEVEGDEGSESSRKLPSSVGEFYDARDDLSTDSGIQSCSGSNNETELREMRLSLLNEIERRRQVEETLEQMQVHWRRLREQLAQVDMFVPLDPTSSVYSMNIAVELRCQLEIARFVFDSLDNDLAKAEAEVEMEMESELQAKNFEISRLSDRLHYYETVNQEMSQRNQEAIEVARLDGQKRKRRQRWIWGSIAATITLGGAVLAWPYLPPGISLTDVDETPCKASQAL